MFTNINISKHINKKKSKVAILFSGHLRNIHEIIINLKENLLDPISVNYDYDIYIHTWEKRCPKWSNKTEQLNVNDLNSLFLENNIITKKIIIENQKQIDTTLNINNYLLTNCKGKMVSGGSITGRKQRNRVKGLFWQYYGHHKILDSVDNIDTYYYIIKTRPDMLYDKFDITLLNYDIFFPKSHLHRGGGGNLKEYEKCNNINNLFFGGKTAYMIKILEFFKTIIYFNKNINHDLIKNYIKNEINFNRLFRYYIMNILLYKPFFCKFNPKIYRNKNCIWTIH